MDGGRWNGEGNEGRVGKRDTCWQSLSKGNTSSVDGGSEDGYLKKYSGGRFCL